MGTANYYRGGLTSRIQISFKLLLKREYPSCLQTTPASAGSQLSSHTVPQAPLRHTSTRPAVAFGPFTSRTSPVLQGRGGGIATEKIDMENHNITIFLNVKLLMIAFCLNLILHRDNVEGTSSFCVTTKGNYNLGDNVEGTSSFCVTTKGNYNLGNLTTYLALVNK